MAIVGAESFGCNIPITRYGEVPVSNNGDGGMYDENSILVGQSFLREGVVYLGTEKSFDQAVMDEFRKGMDYDEALEIIKADRYYFGGGELSIELAKSIHDQLLEITVMRSAIGQCPQEGDDKLLELLSFERIVLETGKLPERGGVLEAYPNLKEYIGQIVKENPEIVSEINEELTKSPIVMKEDLIEVQLETLEEMAQQEQLVVLRALLEGASNMGLSNQKQKGDTSGEHNDTDQSREHTTVVMGRSAMQSNELLLAA